MAAWKRCWQKLWSWLGSPMTGSYWEWWALRRLRRLKWNTSARWSRMGTSERFFRRPTSEPVSSGAMMCLAVMFYAMDSKNGATLFSVIGGHAISAVQSVLGRIEEVGAVLSQRRQTVRVIETGEMIPMKTPDQLVLAAVLQSGAPLSFQLRGGLPRGTRLLWEINGTAGDLRITAKAEQIPVINISPLRVEGGRRGEDGFRELEIPSSFYFGLEDAVVARNVAGVYRLMAQDPRHGTRTAPSFDDAVLFTRLFPQSK